jgi:2-aminobenzoate-CoA ligase
VLKAGGIVVATMPLLRAKELGQMLRKARISHALCDARLAGALAEAEAPDLRHVLHWGDGELEGLCAAESAGFTACDTAAEDICLIGFTSGTTGEPKGTLHFHRDMLAICDAYAREVLRPEPSDIFIGSPPLAFTFGLGGLVLFPFSVGATGVLLDRAGPDDLLPAIARHRATICFTAPTAYRAMLAAMDKGADLSSLRVAVSAGETLPAPVYDEWVTKTGKPIVDGIGSTEMLHIFISNRLDDSRPGCTGRPLTGYQAIVVDDEMVEVAPGTIGKLAVKGPIGCRYLADDRQDDYVREGWNLTGDSFVQDEDGYFHFAARSDDMIISAGYNIAGPEVEAALLKHEAVLECAVIGIPDNERGSIVEAHVVLVDSQSACAALVKLLQEHVKREIAPYKYPRSVIFTETLPKTESGKIQRFRLKQARAA